MISKQAKLTSKGQVTIPLEIRSALKLREGDTLTFEVDKQGQARLKTEQKKSAFAKYAGSLSEDKGLTAKQIAETLREKRGW